MNNISQTHRPAAPFNSTKFGLYLTILLIVATAMGLPAQGIRGFTDTDLFRDEIPAESWGIENTECKSASLSTEHAYQGSASLHLQWDKEKKGCPWIGMGIGWPSWRAVDLSAIPDAAALEFYARLDSGELKYLPLIFILEGYDGKSAPAALNPLGIEGGSITTDWTRISLPLSSFNYRRTGMDLRKVKQLLIQLEGTGDIYIDELSIVPQQNAFPRDESSLSVVHEALPVTLFADELPSGYGLGPKYCPNFQLDTKVKHEGRASIRVQADPASTGCDWSEFGFSWNQWLYTDIAPIAKTAALQGYIRLPKGAEIPTLQIGLEDYDRHTAWLSLAPEHLAPPQKKSEWRQILIPLARFDFEAAKVDLHSIKDMRIIVKSAAPFHLDDLQLISVNSEPAKPQGK